MADVTVHQSTLETLARRMQAESVTLTERWLGRVQQLVVVDRLEAFPSRRTLLDHLPTALEEVAAFIPTTGDIDVSAELTRRAAEFGELRHKQHASVHQLLREYRILGEVLEEFVHREVQRLTVPDPTLVVVAMRRISEAVRVMQQHTVDTFVANYTQTLERQTAQLRKFSRLVSHEMRQPLAVLQVLSRALPIEGNDTESLRMMDIFERSVSRLADVTGKLERLARITHGTDLLPSERDVDLTEVAHEAAAQLSSAAAERGVQVQVHPALPIVRLDPARAELIFVNLIANAIKFSDVNKPVRYVEIDRGPGQEPSVIVRDNGIGMAPARLRTVFREFVRAHSQRDDDVRAWGLGLGLSIVRECMDHANGWVRVDSIEGRGTTVKLSWPPSTMVARPTAG